MYSSRAAILFLLLTFSTYVGAVDPFAQRGGLFSVSYSYLTETDDISLLSRDRSARSVVLDSTSSYRLKGSLRLLSFLYV